MTKKIPKPISGGLILSYKCNAECQHCMYGCSPKWSGDWISEDDLETVLVQLSRTIEPSPYGSGGISLNHGLHFTGGEPFLNYELFCKAVEIAKGLGIPSTFVETNCFWCINDEVARDKLKTLKSKGLKGIMISVNPFYLEFVPFERTERAIQISLEIFGQNVAVYQVEYFRRFKEWGIRDRVPLSDYLRLESRQDFARNVEFFIMGRAAYKLKGEMAYYFHRYPAEQLFGQACLPSFLRDWHNHFDNYGNFVPGYCGGISLGDCRELDRLLEEGVDVEENPVLGFLMDEDLEGLFHFAKDFGYEELESGYFSKCHLCADIRKHLVDRQPFTELVPREFYTHLD